MRYGLAAILLVPHSQNAEYFTGESTRHESALIAEAPLLDFRRPVSTGARAFAWASMSCAAFAVAAAAFAATAAATMGKRLVMVTVMVAISRPAMVCLDA